MPISLIAGSYRLSPLRRVHTTDGELDIWNALDSLLDATEVIRGNKSTNTGWIRLRRWKISVATNTVLIGTGCRNEDLTPGINRIIFLVVAVAIGICW